MRDKFTVGRRLLAHCPLLPITALWLLIDVWLRPSWDLRFMQWLWWIASIVFSLVMWQGAFAASRRMGGWLQTAWVYSAALSAAALVMLAVAFHHIFYTWPTAYAMVHMLREPREAWGYIRDGYDPLYWLVLVVGTVYIVGWWRWGLRRALPAYGRVQHGMLSVLCVAGLVLFGAIHRHANFMVPDAAIAKLAVDLGVNAAIGGVRGRLLQARRPAPAEIYGGAPVGVAAPNLILVIGESVAFSRTGLYGYVRQTTPRLAAVRDARPDDWVQLERAVANASATKVALPALLSGLFPSRESVEQHTFPLLYHYVKAAGYKTALITSQSYAWNNLEGFFLDAGLDHAFTLERSDAEIVNSEGMDDRRMLAEGLATIDRFAQEGPFVVVLQFNCTHYPGYSPPEVQVWDESGGDRDARYDNSIVYMDHLLGMLFEHLDETGLADNTSVVFAADHGEDLGAVHKLHRTDSYYQTTIAVPVFFVIPERQRQRLGAGFARLRSNAGVRTALTDLVPTALDLLGLSGDAKVKRWLEQLDGRSLLRPVADDRLVVVVNTDEHVRWSRKGYAILAGDLKLINYSWTGSMLFDLASDALEQRDLLEAGAVLSPEGRQHVQRVAALVEQTSSLREIHTD